MRVRLIQLFIFLFIFNSIKAQEVKTELPNTIENQFKKLYKKSGSYQVYKVIKKDAFVYLQKNTLDSVSKLKKDIIAKQKQIASQAQNTISLNSTISKLNEDLSISLGKEDNISLLGMQLKKSSYNTLLWGLIMILLASLVFFIYKFNGSNSLTKEAKKSLIEIEQEFEEYRKKSLEKEQKVRRQLQDEINKQRGV